MPEPIANLSPEAVIEAIETNLIDSSVALGRTEEGVVFRGSDVTWVYTGYRALSRVMRARFSPEEAEDRVAEIAECFHQWDAPVVWVVGPSSWPPQLKDYLGDAGFNTNETWMGMAVDLKLIPPQLARKEGLRIELVTEKDQLEAWTLMNDEMWPGEARDGALNIFSPENAGGDPRCRYYLGYVGDQPVVRGMACVRGDTAGLYWIATKPEHRDKGYELALAAHALTEAGSTGAKVGVMPVRGVASPIGDKLGFKPYCQFNVYTWPASPAKTPVC
jgi:GNAT superfamily N-acetyltransferase